MRFKVNPLIILSLILLVVVMIIFADSIVTIIVLLPFTNLVFNGVVFAPECGLDEDPNETGCYDKDNIDGGQVLNCLHSGICPIGVNWQPTGSEEWDATPDSDPHPDDPYQPPTVNPASLIDTDGDGIFDDKDECVFEPELVNGFLDTDGCPETSSTDPDTNETIIVNDLPDVDVVEILVNPPQLTDNLLNSAVQSPNSYIEALEESNLRNTVNLNTMVNNAIIIFVAIVIVMIAVIVILVRGKI